VNSSPVKLAELSLADIPGQLRALATAIEGGVHGNIHGAVIVIEGVARVETVGFGTADPVRSAGLLTLGTANLIQSIR